ncbi:MAG: hypothetical protein V8R80_03000 [Eubacterium sp.]
MKKKVISLVLIGAMVASMAACSGKGGDDANKGGAAPSGRGEAAAPSEGGHKLVVWTWDPAFNIPSMRKLEKFRQRAGGS